MMNADKKLTDDRQEQAAQPNVEHEKQRLQTILETIRVPTIISSLSDGRVLYANQAIAQISQVNLDEVIGFKTGSFYANPDDQIKLREMLREQGQIDDFEIQFRRTDGSLYWALLSARLIDYAGETCVLSTYVDITQRKQVEAALYENEERFRRFTEATIEGLVFHEQGRIMDSNPAALAMFGFSNNSEVIGRNLLEFIKPEFHETVLKQMQLESVAPYEVLCVRPDGSVFPVETSTHTYKYDERIIRATSIRDITRRKHIEAATRNSEEKLRAMYEGTNDAIMLLNEKGFFDCNSQTLKMFGFKTKEEFTATHPVDVSPEFQPDHRDSLSGSQEHMQTAYRQGYDRFEWMHRRANGEEFPAEVVLSAFDFGGQRVLQATVRDITRRKQIEMKLSESEERYRRLSDATVEGIVIHDKGILLDSNETFARMFGYELAEVIGMPATEFLTPETREITVQHIRSGYEKPYEVMGLRKDGSTFPVEITGKAIPYEGRIVRVTALRDITERKQAEDELKRNVNFTTALLDAMPTPVFYKDSQGRYQGCNRAFSEIMGKTAEEIRGRTVHELWPSQNADTYHQKDLELMHNQEHQIYEATTKDKDGNIRPVIFAKDVFYDESGKVAGLVGAFIDITERKQIEARLNESEERYRRLSDATVEGIVIHDKGILLDSNETFARMFGYELAEVIGMPATEFLTPETREITVQHIRSGYEKPYEVMGLRKDGSTFPVEITGKAIPYEGRTVRVTALRDITERKQAEEATRKSEEKFRTIADFTYSWETWSDPQGKYLYVSPACELVSGYAPNEFIENHQLLSEIVLPEDRAILDEHLHDHRSTEETGAIEFRIITRKGRVRWINHVCRAVYDSAGVWQGRRGSNIDITERKQAELDLLLRDRALASSFSAVILLDLNFKPIYVNEAFLKLTGYSYEEAMQLALPNLTGHPEGVKRIDAAVDAQGFFSGEEPVKRKDGSIFPTNFFTSFIRNAEGKPIAIQTAFFDITERKQLETQIEEAYQRRGLQVQLSTQISQSIAAASSLEELYERVVVQVKEQFGYYHTQLLRYDATQDAVVLVTGYGETGAKMLAAGHRLPMGKGLIGTAAATGETILRPTLESDPDWRPNPLLPETKGEIAVPIKLGETILGVLDVQSSVAGFLGADDQLLLEGLCGQIATAIDDTRLREDMSERLEEINRLYRAMSHEGWETWRGKADIPSGFMYDQGGVKQVEDAGLVQELFANIPLTVPGGEVIGNLAVADDPQRPLTSDEETFLLQVSEQIALALESARLFEQTQSALTTIQENEAKLSEALNIAKLANWEYDLEKDVFIFNDQFYSIFHTTAEKVGGYELSSADYARLFVHPEDAPLVGKEIERGLASTERHFSARLEHRFIFADDGSIGYISVEVHLERDENGKIVRWYGANQDITERKKAEVALQENRAALAEALNIAKLANWEYDVEKDIFTFNDQFYSIFHTTAEQMGGYQLSSVEYASRLVHPDDLPVVGAAIGKALSSTDKHYSAQLEHRILYADGGVGYISVEIHIERDDEGKILRYYGANQDITERKLVQDAIAKQAAELETVAQVSTTASTVLNPDQLLQSVVDLAKERFGLYHAHIYTFDDAWNTLLLAAGAGEVGRKLVAEEHAIPMSIEQSLVARAARERKVVIVNNVNSEPGFLPNPLLPETCAEMAVPMTVGDKLLGVFDVQSNNPAGFSDRDANIYVTLAAQVGVALQNARSYMEQAALVTQLRELDRLKSSFLANMSHELRTPLNSILGFADVIIEELDGPLTENMSNDLRLIQKNGQHLLHLINDVLDMAKIEAGRMNLNPESFTAFEVIDEVTSITSTLASEKNLALFIEPDSDRDVKIYADRTRLRQVMINLVNNAIKFTENGKIALKLVSLEGARVLYTIKDTGIGIPPDKLDAVFQEFTQVDSSTTRKAGGTGLGLPISRRLVEMHGGRLWAESTGVNGEGSTFFVELPIEARITETIEKQAK